MRRGRRPLGGLTVGQYLPGDSPVHRRDARLKLVAAFAYVIALFLVAGWTGLLLLAAALIALVMVARVPPRYLWRGLRPLLFLLILTFLLQLPSYPGEPLVSLGPLSITAEALDRAGFLTSRLALILLGSTFLTLTTAPVALTDAIEWLLRPLRRVGVPAHEVALMMVIAIRFIPTLLRELEDLMKAQRARGVVFEVRDPRRLAQAVLPLVVPLFVLSFRRADDLAVAMASRCYRGGEGRTRLREAHFSRADTAAALLLLAVFSVALAAGRV
jgi:energy-coupling factor transport system permease protein